ncbi:helix-turn-helix domain-containing protein [Nocardia sp. SYP-A9097]|uniref:helix-turn-helix domain-containing protein n=1 Tax=Nocardia sp. SYP-A9097 TaxID=2663237 RepID=UPI00129B9276|nr:helix-turn-helix domain-containing protein [Nocardia sp. SYP-A9097]MRH92592.1 helix-turn-helix domain-containing protein [Nocardia sp. SYP-A9097]
MSEHPRIQRDATDTGAREALRRLLVEPTISIPDAARILGIGRSTVYAAVKLGELPAIRVGHRVRIPSKWIREALRVDDEPDIGTR